MPVREFKWLFWHPNLVGPLPLYLSRANYSYDASEEVLKMPLRDRCGSIEFKVSVEMEKGPGGKVTPYNLFDLKITEAEQATLFLYEDMVDLDLPITVKVNGNVVVDKKKVKRNWTFFEEQCMPRNFFIFPFVGDLQFKFQFKARVEPKKRCRRRSSIMGFPRIIDSPRARNNVKAGNFLGVRNSDRQIGRTADNRDIASCHQRAVGRRGDDAAAGVVRRGVARGGGDGHAAFPQVHGRSVLGG